MWELEYLLLFGSSENKTEIFRGKTHLVFPFLDQEEGDAHLRAWAEAIHRWRGGSPPRRGEEEGRPQVEVAGVTLTRFPGPIQVRVPFDGDILRAIHSGFWQRELWEGQPEGLGGGWESPFDHTDITLTLWQLFESFTERYGGDNSGRGVGIALSDTDEVEPDQFLFHAPRRECMIGDPYFKGAPELIAEVLSPASRAVDRGERMEVYRRAGVEHLWLLDPALETVETFAREGESYRRTATYGAGDTFRPAAYPECEVRVAALFDTQRKRHADRRGREDDEPLPEWLHPRERRLGLEYLLIAGHPERRHEIWNNRAPCFIAFGSEAEARHRLRHFLGDACRWEATAAVAPRGLEPGVEVAKVGRSRFTRRGTVVRLDVAVDARRYAELLAVWARDDTWDWAEEPEP